ncbi:MAG TPA: hypothetical protein VN962_02565 [Polyangia bacterium]|nr:hypothetical protein [Polyangia bacterium]
MPSSAVQPIDPASHLRVVHEDLTFRCQGRSCQVTATYAIDADAAIATELAFVLPVDMAVAARVGSASAPTTVTRLNAPPPGFNQRLDVRHEYSLPDGEALPPLYQAVARVSFAPGRNQASFSYEQPLGARESEYSYFHDGTMIPRLLYVLWPLREWKHAPGFTIALRIEMDREPPGWWKRKFGHPAEVYCYGFKGQQTQIGHRLVYTATLSDNFPDYLQCDVGP